MGRILTTCKLAEASPEVGEDGIDAAKHRGFVGPDHVASTTSDLGEALKGSSTKNFSIA